MEDIDYGKYKCEASNIVGNSETVIELIDAVDPNEQQAVKTKHNKHHNQHDSNFISRNRVESDYADDQLDEQNDSYQYYNNNSESEPDTDDKSKAKSPKKNNNLKKYSNRNKTMSKYQMNKANRLADPDNRLQKAKGIQARSYFLNSIP